MGIHTVAIGIEIATAAAGVFQEGIGGDQRQLGVILRLCLDGILQIVHRERIRRGQQRTVGGYTAQAGSTDIVGKAKLRIGVLNVLQGKALSVACVFQYAPALDAGVIQQNCLVHHKRLVQKALAQQAGSKLGICTIHIRDQRQTEVLRFSAIRRNSQLQTDSAGKQRVGSRIIHLEAEGDVVVRQMRQIHLHLNVLVTRLIKLLLPGPFQRYRTDGQALIVRRQVKCL